MILGGFLSILIGVSLGLLGGGGSILTVPILLYAMKVEPHQAIAMSLFVVATTSGFSAIRHASKGNVSWKTGFLFSLGAMSGAYVGGRIGALIPAAILLVAFSLMMGLTAIMMMRKGFEAPGEPRPVNWKLLLFEGILVGAFTGMVGAGGGFLVVPALVFLAGMDMKHAIGTSLFVISLKSVAGLAGYLSEISFDWSIALTVSGLAVVGSFLGSHWSQKISQERLRKIFAWFIIAMAIFILVKEVSLT